MLFLAKLILVRLRKTTNLHIRNVTKISTGQILELYISNELLKFPCKVNINLFFVAFE